MAIVFNNDDKYILSILQNNSITQNKINEIMKNKSNNTNNTKDIKDIKEIDKSVELVPKDNVIEKKKDIVLDCNITNQLFWYFYVLKNGYTDFCYKYSNGVINVDEINVVAKQMSVNFVDLFEDKEIKKKLKMNKINNVGMIKNNLNYDDVMSIETFISLCLVNNIRIMIMLDDCKYFSLLLDDEESNINNVLYISKNKYSLDMNNDKKREELIKNRIMIDNVKMTLGVISKYTVKELREMYEKVVPKEYKIDEKNKRILKKDIYETLLKYY